LKNILLTATFSITILTLFFAPSATNLAFAGISNQACLELCAQDESLCNFFNFGNCAEDRIACEAACPIDECNLGSDCGPGGICSQFACIGGECFLQGPGEGEECGINDVCESNVCRDLECVQDVTDCDDGISCTDDSCDRALGCQSEETPACFEKVAGKTIPIETTSLILAGAQSFSWMIPVVLSVLGIGLFIVSRKSE